MSVTVADIEAARRTIAGQVLRTPMLPAPKLSALTGAEVFVKYENLQVTNSFKERGALNKLASLGDAERARGVIAMSAGNHAQAVAYHAARLRIPATIVMPVTTPFVKVEATQAMERKWCSTARPSPMRRSAPRSIARERDLIWVHPYDDARVIAGQGTIALEMLEETPDLDLLVIPIGGGGLIAGNAVAARSIRPSIEIIGAEAALYPSFWNALARRGPRARRADAGGRHRGQECRQAHAADRARAGRRNRAGRRGASRARGQRLSDLAEDDGGRRRRGRARRHAGQAGALSRPQGRPHPVRRQYRSAHPRFDHGARARARGSHRLVPAHHPGPARRARADRDAARAAGRQHSRGRSPPALPRRAGEGRQAGRHGGNARPRAWRARFSRRWRRRAPTGADRDRHRRWSRRPYSDVHAAASQGAAARKTSVCAFSLHDRDGTGESPARGSRLARERASHCARLFRRRFARRLHAWDQQGNPEAGARLERAARDRRPFAARDRLVLRPSAIATIRNTTPKQVYFDLLREIGRSVELRVVVDIIAGASAGGINGTMLARALSHDLPMGALRDLWIENADVSVLLAPDARAGTWSKWFLTPFIWAASKTGRFRLDRGHGGAPEAFAVRAFALVQAAARRADHGRSDVRRGHLDGRRRSAPTRHCCPPASRSICSSR